jgi:hypothetical protein
MTISGRCQGYSRRDSLSAEGADCWLRSRPSVAIAFSVWGVQGWPKLSRKQLPNPPWLENIGPGAMLIRLDSAARYTVSASAASHGMSTQMK